MVLIHAMNPYGFAWLRRVNEHNIDLNRNFLLEGQPWTGVEPGYVALDSLINPRSAPTRFDPFLLRAGFHLLRKGYNSVKSAVAVGQYEYPDGLFFGGKEPARTQHILSEHLPRWVQGAQRVIHVDLHTGYGKWGTHILSVSDGEDSPRVQRLRREFGPTVDALSDSGPMYRIRGDLGSWLQEQLPEVQYDCLLAEFGTHHILEVMSALRIENRAHHWAADDAGANSKAKSRLKEAFAPADSSWRQQTVSGASTILERAINALNAPSPDAINNRVTPNKSN